MRLEKINRTAEIVRMKAKIRQNLRTSDIVYGKKEKISGKGLFRNLIPSPYIPSENLNFAT
jgi:hypothetical protein